MSTTLVQLAELGPADLWSWAMGDLGPELRAGAPGDTIVYTYNGAGTAAYERPPSLDELAARYPAPGGARYRYTAAAGWSAGVRAVQRQLDAALYRGGRVPNAVLLADGLYAPLVGGKPNLVPLMSVIDYACMAAGASTNHAGPLLVEWHTQIATPYASSSQCSAAVRAEVERRVGRLEAFEAPELDGAPVISARRLGNYVVLAYPGNGKQAHLDAVHRIDEIMRAFVPFASRDCRWTGEQGCFPDADGASLHDGASPQTDDAFAAALLAAAAEDVGQREIWGANRSPWVDALCRAHGAPVGSAYCGAALTEWMRRAARRLGRPTPILGSVRAKSWIPQLQAHGTWRARASLSQHVRPGWVLVSHRGLPGALTGHVHLVKEVLDGERVLTFEANTSPRQGMIEGVYEMERRLDDPLLLGGGALG